MSFKVFTAGFTHESHSFSPILTDRAIFIDTNGVTHGARMLDRYKGTSSEMGGVIDGADRYGWTLIPSVFADAMPSGPVTEDAYEHFVGTIISDLTAAVPVDGVQLVLHGAMVVTHIGDAEGELVRRVRAVVGDKTPIAVTFDLHGNISDDLARTANIACAYRTTPHIDQFGTAARAADILQRAMVGEIRPQISYAQRPMFDGLDLGRTISGHGPMVDALALAQKLAAENPTVLDVAVLAGFEWSDKYWTGPSTLTTTDNDPESGIRICNAVMDYAWTQRHRKTVELLAPADVMKMVQEPSDKEGPLLIGDYTDCPGAAAMGDNVVLLRAMLDAKLQNATLASIADADAVKKCQEAGEGAVVSLSLGGKLDPNFSGEPLKVDAKVVCLSDGRTHRTGPYYTGTPISFGDSCLIQVEGVSVIVATNRVQIDDQAQFRLFGVEPKDFDVVACKAVNHFRADFEPICRKLVYVEVGGIASTNFKQFNYTNVRRPIWPLDDI